MATLFAPTSPPSPSPLHTSPWQWNSPVPYVFGGLAAMLGLIAFALLVLACSFNWSVDNPSEDDQGQRDIEAGMGDGSKAVSSVFEEKYLVIMAGQDKPTYLATSRSSKGSSFGSKRSVTSSENSVTLDEKCEEKKVESASSVS